MNFRTAITYLAKVYKFLEKTHLDKKFELESYIDNSYPQFLSRLQNYSRISKFVLLATNGKKTTLNLINQILDKDDKTYITNVKNNKRYPYLISIILDLAYRLDNFGFDHKKDYYSMAQNVFELAPSFVSTKFDILLLHNLFTDQKYLVSLNEKRKLTQEALLLNSKLALVINADEPLFYNIDEVKDDIYQKKKRDKFYYGFKDITFFENDEILTQKNDYLNCPICGCKLEYKKRFYSHLGDYCCGCGFKRPKPHVEAEAKVFKDYCFLDIYYNNDKLSFKIPLGGVYSAYNVLAAIAFCLYLGIPRKVITETLEDYKFLKARDEIIRYKNKTVKIKVAKNPVSLTEDLRELWGEKNVKAVFCMSDKKEDYFDTSWIFDANFESVSDFENKIYATGSRCDDLALKLKYSRVNPAFIVIDSNIKRALECCFWDLEEKESMLVIASPSTVEEVYKVFKA